MTVEKIYRCCALATSLVVVSWNVAGYIHVSDKDKWKNKRVIHLTHIVCSKALIYGFMWPLSVPKMVAEISFGRSFGSMFDDTIYNRNMVVRHFIPCGELMYCKGTSFSRYIAECFENSPHK